MTETVHPDLAKVARYLPSRSLPRRAIKVARLLVNRPVPGCPTGVEVWDTTATTGTGPSVPVRVYLPDAADAPLPVLIWIHGGGMVMGSHVNDAHCGHFASELGVAVVSVKYRLAPEHPYPAALDDLVTAVEWVRMHHSTLGFDATRICVGGQSAGGGLAASLTQRLHDDGVAVLGQLLIYPMLDDRTAARRDIGRDAHLLWTRGSNRTGWAAYLGTEPGDPRVTPGAVPARRIDLGGLAPAWIGVGSLDLFLDESVTYAERLSEAGVECELEVVDGAFHGFEEIVPNAPVSRRFMTSQTEFLRGAFGLS